MSRYLPTMMEDRAGSAPKIGTIRNGQMWNGTRWVPVGTAAPTIPNRPATSLNTIIPNSSQPAAFANRPPSQKAADQLARDVIKPVMTLDRNQSRDSGGKPLDTGGSGGGGGGGGGGSSSSSGGGSPAQPMSYQRPDLRGGQALAEKYGLTYGRENIERILNESTNAKFNEWDAQGRKLRDQQLTDYAAQYDQYLQYARQNRDKALRSGLSRGSAVSQDIMSQMAAQKGGAEKQTLYQQGLADLVNQRGTQLGADKFNAMNMSNELGLALGGLDANLYQSDTAGLTGFQQYLASMAQSEAQVRAAGLQAGASRYAADRGYNAAALAGGGTNIMDYAKKLGLDPDLEADFITGKISATEATQVMADRKKDSLKPDPFKWDSQKGGYYTASGQKVG